MLYIPPPPDTDGDGLPDAEDDCPDEPGSFALNGCPDRDGDSVADDEDRCPDTPGPAGLQGCPDTDGDGVIDREDACPAVAGLARFDGCPDADADGIADLEEDIDGNLLVDARDCRGAPGVAPAGDDLAASLLGSDDAVAALRAASTPSPISTGCRSSRSSKTSIR